jgi:hypothetical protein
VQCKKCSVRLDQRKKVNELSEKFKVAQVSPRELSRVENKVVKTLHRKMINLSQVLKNRCKDGRTTSVNCSMRSLNTNPPILDKIKRAINFLKKKIRQQAILQYPLNCSIFMFKSRLTYFPDFPKI